MIVAEKRQTVAKRRNGFVLVITLIMAALVAVIVIGLLTSASLERSTATSYDQRYQAELAAESGLEAAKQALYAIPASGTSQTMNDGFIVVSYNNASGVPYYYVGSAVPTSTASPTPTPSIQYFPLFSGGSQSSRLTVTAGVAPVVTPSPIPSPIASQVVSSNPGATPIYYPKLFSTAPHSTYQTNIRTQWQTVPVPSPSPTPGASSPQYRYTYWIEDLTGYVDANVAGNTNGTGSTHLRVAGYNPNEVALFTLFGSTDADSGSTYAKTLVGEHPLLFTRLSTRVSTANSSDDTACTTSLSANLQTDSEQNLIPYGLGYKNQGQLKTNVNTIVANTPNDAGITTIATTIKDNLPNFFSTRRGGLVATQGYLENLAANMINYAQVPASTSLVGTNLSTGKSYRGVDLYPFVVEYCDEFQWTMPSPPGGSPTYYQTSANSDYFADVTVTTFVQVWNMFGKDITSGQLRFVDSNKTGVGVFHKGNGNPSGTPTSFNAYDTVGGTWRPWQAILDFSQPAATPTPSPSPTPPKPPAPSSTPIIGAGTLHANEYKVFQIAQRRYTYDAGPSDPSKGNSSNFSFGLVGSPTLSSNDTASSYQVYWNGVLVDQPPNGITRNTWTWDPKGGGPTPQFHSTMPALRYSTGNTAPFLLGDPRGNYYIQASQVDVAYADTSWWGRILMTGSTGSTLYANEQRTVDWPDGGHNTTTPGPSPSGTQPPTSPTPAPLPALETGKAPARLAKTGQYNSITELSYIYDPAQWNPLTSAPGSAAAVNSTWQNTWKNNFSGADGTYDSHSTLRIGRPEHKSFDVDGSRAWQLLDIFSAGDPSPNGNPATPSPLSNQISTRGKININTASTEVLRALGAGIRIGNLNSADVDQAIQPSTVYGPETTKAADIFATNVSTARQQHPFISTAQLANLKGSNGESFFGNPDQWPSNGPTEWNDAASEQYFAKIYNFTTVRSRNFRIFVTGQAYIPANGPQPERVLATANKVYEVFLKPTRPSSAITDQVCQVVYQADVY
jgi:hypothetical protein